MWKLMLAASIAVAGVTTVTSQATSADPAIDATPAATATESSTTLPQLSDGLTTDLPVIAVPDSDPVPPMPMDDVPAPEAGAP